MEANGALLLSGARVVSAGHLAEQIKGICVNIRGAKLLQASRNQDNPLQTPLSQHCILRTQMKFKGTMESFFLLPLVEP